MTERPRGSRLHRLLMRLHPRRFRERFGAASERLFAEWVRNAPNEAERRLRARQAVRDAAGTLAGAWLEELRERSGALGRLVAGAFEATARSMVATSRSARRNPAQAVTVVLTVAVAVGANAALFSIARTLLLRPLPYQDAERLVRVHGGTVATIGPDGFRLKEAFTGLPGLEATTFFISGGSANLTAGSETGRVRLSQVAPGFFDVLGLSPALGRGLGADDAGEPVAVIGHALWRSSFAGDPGVLGRSMTLNGRSYTIVGVAPPEADFPAESAVWLPLPFAMDFFGNAFRPQAIARLQPGAQPATLNGLLAERYEAAGDTRSGGDFVPPPELVPLRQYLLRDVSPALFTLLAAALLVLLLGGLNLAGLWSSQATERIDDLRLRRALGASRRRILTDLVAQNVVLAVVGGGAALFVARIVMGALATRIPASVPGRDAIALDGTTAVAALSLAVIAGLVFGTIAAVSALRIERGATRSRRDGRTERRLQTAFVVAQGALALVLVAGSLLMVRSFQQLASAPLGFEPDGTLAFQVRLPETDATPEVAGEYARRLEGRLGALPGVISVGLTDLPPLSFEMGYALRARPAGDEDFDPVMALVNRASDDYFSAAGIPVLRGRPFAAGSESDPGLIVDRTVADRLFPGESAAGRAIDVLEHFADGPVWRETRIRAVVGRVRVHGVREAPYPAVYRDLARNPSHSLGVVLRVDGDPARFAGAVRAATLEIRPTVAPYNLRSLRAVASELLDTDRVLAIIGTAFALMAIALAALGLYGLMVRRIVRRRREYGVRMALGAEAWSLVGGAVRGAVGLGLLAVALGFPGALVAARLIRSRLYGVAPFDPMALGVGCALLLVVITAAAWLPARRISRVDPREALAD